MTRPVCIDYDCKHNQFNGECWRDGGTCQWHIKPRTNGDWIRSTSDEVLARYIDVNMLPDRFLTDHYMKERAIDVILEWLNTEVKNDQNMRDVLEPTLQPDETIRCQGS